MNDHKFKLLALAIVGVIGISIALIAPMPSIAAPPGNPPTANVSPNFSGLNVAVDATIGDDLVVGGRLSTDRFMVNTGSTIINGDTGFFGLTTFFNDLDTYGDIITHTGDIGSFYTKRMTTAVRTGGTEIPGTSCYLGDWLSGCSAVFNYDSASDRFYGTYSAGNRTCRAQVKDGGGGDDSVTIYARCFDPEGARSGTYEEPY